ncbi:MAG TPA: hypothetical protein DCZ01_03065 [Elusimicrobia bacterium]|nr:MAG: hypothetical protein A2X37_07955 [Elusimicrobia bacterium GWA2_66_18]OGR70569.1 MAG: hypothetical protein A2X40_04830 [Elusimicrobia bacterium GWC2_65_9]HAZ07511.1 hypothetical protein [Elusimicrobiota bacterium]
MLKVGCEGFSIGQDRYWRTFSFVEAKTGERMPRQATLAEWKAGAPRGAEFALQAFRLITHGREDRGFPEAGKKLSRSRQDRCGAFRESLEASEAWVSTKAAAEILDAKIVVFETPISFQPGPDSLRDMYRFFKAASRGRLTFVWHSRGAAWRTGLSERVCADLGLLRAYDPLREAAPKHGTFRYLRSRGPRVGTLSVDELSTIRLAAQEAPSCLVLSHRDAYRDGVRLLESIASHVSGRSR